MLLKILQRIMGFINILQRTVVAEVVGWLLCGRVLSVVRWWNRPTIILMSILWKDQISLGC